MHKPFDSHLLARARAAPMCADDAAGDAAQGGALPRIGFLRRRGGQQAHAGGGGGSEGSGASASAAAADAATLRARLAQPLARVFSARRTLFASAQATVAQV